MYKLKGSIVALVTPMESDGSIAWQSLFDLILVELFPNPSLDLVHITGLANIQTHYQLKDALGRVVRTGTFNGSNETLDLIGLSLGNYRLTIEGIGSFSIVKQ